MIAESATDASLGALPPHVREMAGRVLAAMVTSMRGAGAGWTSGDLAARLGVRPRTEERDLLDSALTAMRRARPRLVHFEAVAYGEPFEWMLTADGIAVGRALPTGVSGAPRHGRAS